MRQFKKHILKAEDVVPHNLYEAYGLPCRVICTHEPGWKRGYVSVFGNGKRCGPSILTAPFYALVEDFNGTLRSISLQVTNDNFYFTDSVGSALLKPFSPNWIIKEEENLSRRFEHLTHETDHLKKIKNAFETLYGAKT